LNRPKDNVYVNKWQELFEFCGEKIWHPTIKK